MVEIRAFELGQRCYERVKIAIRRHEQGQPPTRLQAETLRGLGRPPAGLVQRYPPVVEMVQAARRG